MYISIGKVAKLAGISITSIRRWEEDNYHLPDYRTKGNHRRYLYTRILEFLGLKKPRNQTEVIIYGRVSASKQKDDLKRQIEDLKLHAKENGWKLTGVYQDIGSGLNDNRKGLLKMILHTNYLITYSVATRTEWRALEQNYWNNSVRFIM